MNKKNINPSYLNLSDFFNCHKPSLVRVKKKLGEGGNHNLQSIFRIPLNMYDDCTWYIDSVLTALIDPPDQTVGF